MTNKTMQQQWASSHLSGGSMAYVDALYEEYLTDPNAVPEVWRSYFDDLPRVTDAAEVSHKHIREHFLEQAKHGFAVKLPASMLDADHETKQARLMQLIHAYRLFGHHKAVLDPIGLDDRKDIPSLTLEHHKLSSTDLDTQFETHSPLFDGMVSLRNIIEALESTYCRSVGVEYMHITDTKQTEWLQQKLEAVHGKPSYSAKDKNRILQQLTAAEGLEKYLGSKYVGQKRFSLEGGDSLIPMMQALVHDAGEFGAKEVVIGMAHRGRLNVLINVLGKAPDMLFQEFEGKRNAEERSGDVKYHMGYSSDIKTAGGGVHLSLSFNPSHLEIISPVVMGSVRSRLRRRDDLEHKDEVLPVVVHGDAAFAGQGVVMETFNFSQARGYGVGGTIHIVINNQIGFTTSNPLDARSTLYCTDVAKMVQAPIFHVNGDDPEAVIYVTKIAHEYRMKFKRDVVIDLVCYRRHGHNEADEPSVTQPEMYQSIKKMKTPRELYALQLEKEGVVTASDADAMVYSYRDALDKGEPLIETMNGDYEGRMRVDWSPYINACWDESVDTAISQQQVKFLSERILDYPQDFSLHPVVKRLFAERQKMADDEIPMNWGFAESMAFASLVEQGHSVRVSGQDCGRGTFAHRHAVLHDFKTGQNYVPLEHISKNQKPFVVIDSVLSEEAVLAYEYGFAAAEPNTLVIWEAQFGDFCNGAQVVIDQFISSGEQKWGRLSGLVMFLPHGFEGQGPEHSSARLERFMQLCAQHNMQVAVPTTPAQIFHLIRRQMVRNFRKPLIVMTPKSLLRHKLAVSPLEDLMSGKFHNVIPEVDEQDKSAVRRVIFCSGKVYYDLLATRRSNQQKEVAIIRLEQLYPFPHDDLKALMVTYPNAKDVVWCQEEPKNQGAWFSSQHHMRSVLTDDQVLRYVGRDFFAAPAVGSAALHNEQQQQLVNEALEGVN